VIHIIKFVDGTEILGSIIKQDSKTVTVKNPVQINYKNIEQPIPSVSLTRFLQFAKDREPVLEKKMIIAMCEAMSAMESYYDIVVSRFEGEIDAIVEAELTKVALEESEDVEDMYSAILDKLTTNKPLN
jgi:hypothetical protein